jgi:hypothetical protein
LVPSSLTATLTFWDSEILKIVTSYEERFAVTRSMWIYLCVGVAEAVFESFLFFAAGLKVLIFLGIADRAGYLFRAFLNVLFAFLAPVCLVLSCISLSPSQPVP